MLAQALINYGMDDNLTPHSQIKRVVVYTGTALVIGVVGLLATDVTATVFTAIMVGLVGFNIYQSLALAEPQTEH